MNMLFEDDLKRLRSTVTTEANKCMRDRRGAVSGAEIAAWLIKNERDLAMAGLGYLINDAIERQNDEASTRQTLHFKPDLAGLAEDLRQVSETLGVGLWYLLELEEDRAAQCCHAAVLIHQLRAEECKARADAILAAEEYLRPVMEGHPEMTAGEAIETLRERTDETLRGLE